MSSYQRARKTFVGARHHKRITVTLSYVVVVATACSFVGVYPTVVTAIVVCALMFGVTASVEARWRLHGWRTPEAVESMRFPPPTPRRGEGSFSLIVPAKNEVGVLQHTLESLACQTFPWIEIVATLIEGDDETIREAEAARAAYPDKIQVLVMSYPHEMKPYQLNAALQHCIGEYVGVIDAEDTVSTELLYAVEAAFQSTDADIVQGGVQLMNLGSRLRDWFCVHNVLEYFFWFFSRMPFQADQGFVPLGGNTVFIRRELLERAGGWPVTLTEDCALGVRLSTEFGATTVAFAEPALATREETPDDLTGLLHQRIRWDAGFGAELLRTTWWRLPGRRQRFLACYILATPFLQAGAGLLLPLTVLSALVLDAPAGLVLVTFLPYIPILLTLVLQVVGLHEFGRLFAERVRLRHYVFLVLGFFPYQLVLAWAAVCAVRRLATNNMTWWKTSHSNKHRSPVLAPVGLESA
jgi:cellulose synthase/poly-beta-1,6-N-acetylglucosamine synthase-like glycosyltransferase